MASLYVVAGTEFGWALLTKQMVDSALFYVGACPFGYRPY